MSARAFWFGYAAALLAIVAACSGCATAPTTPQAGARCTLQLGAELLRVQVVGPAYGLVDVRADARRPMLLVSPAALTDCRGAA